MGYTKPAATVAAILEQQGRTPGWLSESSGVALPEITGEADLTMSNALLLARTLGVSLAELAGEEDPLTVVELARRVNLTPDTVYRKANSGAIPGFKIGGSWRFYLSEVVAAGRPQKVDEWEQPARAKRRSAA